MSGVIRVFGVRAGHCGDGHVGDVLAVIRFHHFIRIGDRDGFAHRQPVDRPCAAVLVPGVAGAVRSGDSARAVVGVAYWDVFQLHAADVGHCDFVGDDVPHSRSFPVGFFFCFHAPQLRHRGGIGVWVRIRLNNNGPAVDVQRAGLEIHHIIVRAVGIGFGRQAGQLHGIAAHVGGRCGVRHKDRLALQIAVWRIAVDETVVRGCKFRERVAVDHAVFARADHQRARSDSDAAWLVPDDVVLQYGVIFFGQSDILKQIVSGFRFCGDRSVFKAAFICVQRQRVICHQRGNLQLGAAAALGCGILCRRGRFLCQSVAVAGGKIADKCADGAAADRAAVLFGLDLIVPIRVIVQADISRAGDFVLKQLVFRIVLCCAVRVQGFACIGGLVGADNAVLGHGHIVALYHTVQQDVRDRSLVCSVVHFDVAGIVACVAGVLIEAVHGQASRGDRSGIVLGRDAVIACPFAGECQRAAAHHVDLLTRRLVDHLIVAAAHAGVAQCDLAFVPVYDT